MKLWHKTSLICTAVLVLTVTLISVILIINTSNQILDLTISQTKELNYELMLSTSQMSNYYAETSDSQAVKDSTIKYCFSQFADDTSVLIKGEQVIYSSLSINPLDYVEIQVSSDTFSEYLPEDTVPPYTQKVFEGEISGRNILIVGETASFFSDGYIVFTVKDITDVYASIDNSIFVIVITSVTGLFFAIILIIILMKRMTKPIEELAKTSNMIANGEYSVRAKIKSKDELSLLANDFNKMADTVESRIRDLTETNERQKIFIGGVSHEFKTPLTVMLLHSKMLKNANMSEDERYKSLTYIESQCEWLNKMVITMINLLNESEIERENTSVKALTEAVALQTTETFKDRNIDLITEIKCESMYMNSAFMELLLINLLDNASKSYDDYSVKNTVSLRVYENVFEVSDGGRGMDETLKERIFEPFYMIDKSRSKKSGGTGLGLSLVKKIADLHGAKIEVETELGKGTKVKIIM